MNDVYKSFEKHQEKAREHYKIAVQALKDMSAELTAGGDDLKTISKKMVELEDIVTSPLI